MSEHTPIVTPAVRHDGWTEARIAQFLDHLANDGSVLAACGRVGLSREAAYRLRRRDAVFARAWNAALVLAREASAEVLECRAIHGVEEDIWYRGELVGTRRKYDSRLLLAHMARLDKIADDERAGEDAARFDELLALLGGEPVPEGHERDDHGVPVERDIHLEIAADDAEAAFAEAWRSEHPVGGDKADGDETDPDDFVALTEREIAGQQAYAAALVEEKWRVRLEAGAQWDGRRDQCHSAVDRLLAEPVARAAEVSASGTVSTVSTSPEIKAGRYGSLADAYAAANPLNHRYARA